MKMNMKFFDEIIQNNNIEIYTPNLQLNLNFRINVMFYEPNKYV